MDKVINKYLSEIYDDSHFQKGSSFKNTFYLGMNWFKNHFKKNNPQYKYVNDGDVMLIYNEKEKHIASMSFSDGTFHTNMSLEEVKEGY